MRLKNRKKQKQFIEDILSVKNDAESASLRAIKAFAPYISDRGKALPFLCKTVEDYSIEVSSEEYFLFLEMMDNHFYDSYFKPCMNPDKAMTVLHVCAMKENFVAYDYLLHISEKYKNDVQLNRLSTFARKTIDEIRTQKDISAFSRTRGDASYFAYQVHMEMLRSVGRRSATLNRK